MGSLDLLPSVFAHNLLVVMAAGHCVGLRSYAHPGAVDFVQKFGLALQVKPHFHALVLGGVYVTESPGAVTTFHPVPSLADLGVTRVQTDARARIERVVRCLIARDGADHQPIEGHEDSA